MYVTHCVSVMQNSVQLQMNKKGLLEFKERQKCIFFFVYNIDRKKGSSKPMMTSLD